MVASDKDTIYIDIDDEITGIIDKLHASSGKVVALVLPKRAGVFQSIVNMKLLKRAADSSKKHLVLITSEAGLLPLAGAAGVHVAKTLTSKPEIPAAPQLMDDQEETVNEDDSEPETPDVLNGGEPAGKLAGTAPATAAGEMETLELDDDAAADVPGAKTFEPPAKGKKGKGKKDKKLSIPNFDRFRLLLALGALILVLLIIGLILAIKVLPKANIVIDTNAVNVNSSSTLNLSTTATSLKTTDNTIPAKIVQQQKTYTQQATTTGQKNNGNKAQGSVTMSAGSCGPNVPNGISQGAGLSASSQTYITQDEVSFVPTVSHGKCIFEGVNSSGQASIPIVAQSGGASYNVSGVPFSVSGRTGDVSASGSATGGTDNIVQTVNQNDINGAKAKISTDDPTVKKTLQDQLKAAGYFAIIPSYSPGTPSVTTSASVGETASNVTVTETITYSMFGAHESDLKTVVDKDVKTQIDTSKQSILSEGLDKANFSVTSASPTGAQITMGTVATAGPDLDTDGIKQTAAGQKSGQIKADLEGRPGVKNVTVKLSPFWVSSVPKKTSKITVTIAKPTATASSHANTSQP